MEHSTEEEQLARLKKWWGSYGNYVFYGALIVFGAMYGYKSWKDQQDAILERSSVLYTRAFVAFSDGNDSEFKATSNQLLADYPDSVYADFIRMLLAKEVIAQEKYTEAENYLLQVVNKTKQKSLKNIAIVRLARIYFSQGKIQQASEQADKLNKTDFDFFAHELYGDINVVNKQYESAAKEYNIALEKQKLKFPGSNSILQSKLQALSKDISKDN